MNRITKQLTEEQRKLYRAILEKARAAMMTRIKAAVADLNGIAQRGSDADVSSAIAALESIADQAETYQDCYHIYAAERAAKERDKP